MIAACLFDLDGVIVDTAKYHFLAWRRLADELGFEFTEEQNQQLKGVSRMQSLDILLGYGGITLDEEEKHLLAEKKNSWYVEYILQMDASEILPGAKELLQSLREHGIKIALGSASKNAMTILRNVQLTEQFDAIVDGTKTTQAKPDPEVFLLAAQELNTPPEQCVVFEDSAAGIEAALRAGMRSIGIGSQEHLGRADRVVASLEELPIEQLFEFFSG